MTKKLHNFTADLRKSFSYHWVILAVILLLGAFFRFYDVPARYGFDYDPMRDALISWVGAHNLQFPLIGPHSGIGPFSFGPWYYYQLILVRILFPFTFSPWIYLGIISLVFVFLMYKIGVELESRTLGLLLAFIAALTPSQVGPTAGLSNPNFVPLFAAIAVYIFIRLLKRSGSLWWYLVWGLSFSIGVNHHYQMAGLLILPFIYWILNRKKLVIPVLVFIAGLVIGFLPMVVYDLLHHWANTRGLWFYVTQGRNSTYIPNSWTIYVRDFWISFWSYILGVPRVFGMAILVYSIILSGIIFVRHKMKKEYVLLFIALGINILFLRYFSAARDYYYFLYLHPLLFIFIGYVFYQTAQKKVGLLINLLVGLAILPFLGKQDWQRVMPQPGYTVYGQGVHTLEKKYPNASFVLYQCNLRERNKILAYDVFLEKDHKINTQGDKIGFSDDAQHCGVTSQKYLSNIQVYDLSGMNKSLLQKYGWERVTPEDLFQQLTQ